MPGVNHSQSPWHVLKKTDVMLTQSAKACKSLYLCRHNLPGVEPGPVPGAHLPGVKALTGSFAMSGFTGYSAPGKRPFAKP